MGIRGSTPGARLGPDLNFDVCCSKASVRHPFTRPSSLVPRPPPPIPRRWQRRRHLRQRAQVNSTSRIAKVTRLALTRTAIATPMGATTILAPSSPRAQAQHSKLVFEKQSSIRRGYTYHRSTEQTTMKPRRSSLRLLGPKGWARRPSCVR